MNGNEDPKGPAKRVSPSEAAALAILDDAISHWIPRELEQRKLRGMQVPEASSVRKALRIFPRGGPPIVRVDDEVGFVANCIAKRAVTKGDAVGLAQIADVLSVEAPRADGKPAAYELFLRVPSPRAIFSFLPNVREVTAAEWEEEEGVKLARFFFRATVEQLMGPMADVERVLRPYGWWLTHDALPDPLGWALDAARGGASQEEVDKIFVVAYTPDRLTSMVGLWMSVPEFKAHERPIREAVQAHNAGQLSLSISTLTPLVEGIITSWLRSNGGKVPYTPAAKAREFEARARAVPSGLLTDESLSALAAAWDRLGVYERFDWGDPNVAALNRHGLAHGKPRAEWTSADSLRVMLFLDSLYRQLRYRVAAKEAQAGPPPPAPAAT